MISDCNSSVESLIFVTLQARYLFHQNDSGFALFSTDFEDILPAILQVISNTFFLYEHLLICTLTVFRGKLASFSQEDVFEVHLRDSRRKYRSQSIAHFYPWSRFTYLRYRLNWWIIRSIYYLWKCGKIQISCERLSKLRLHLLCTDLSG